MCDPATPPAPSYMDLEEAVTDLRAQLAAAEKERDEARESLADAGTLMGRTIAMSYCTSAEIQGRDHTHALPSAMLRVIRERDDAMARAIAAESRAGRMEARLRITMNDLENAHAMLCATADPEGECGGCAVSERMDATRAVLAEVGE